MWQQDRFQRVWPHARVWGLRVTATATAGGGIVGLLSAAAAARGEVPSLTGPFAIAGVGLLIAAALMAAEVRVDLVEVLLGGLVGGSFGVTLAELSAQALTVDDHYKSLWVPAVIGALLVSFIAFRAPDSDRQRNEQT